MHETGGSGGDEHGIEQKHDLARKAGAAAWGLFFIWIGVVFLLSIPRSVTLLGMGVITLGSQVLRRSMGLNMESFWVMIGALFVIGGVLLLLDLSFSVLPHILIMAGMLLLVSIFRGKRQSRR